MGRRKGNIMSDATESIVMERFRLNPHKLDMRLDGDTMSRLRRMSQNQDIPLEQVIENGINHYYNEIYEDEEV